VRTRFEELRAQARELGPAPVALVGAGSVSGLEALGAAALAGIAEPVLVGDEAAARQLIEGHKIPGLEHARFVPAPGPGGGTPVAPVDPAAAAAVALAREGEVAVLLKGSLRTDQLMRAALDRDAGLRTGRLLSDVLLYEDTLSGRARLVAVTDGGINPAPDADMLQRIVENAVDVLQALGFERPRVALLSATEAVSDAVPSTIAARAVADWAATALADRADVAGPLALDNALLVSAAAAKGITGPVAGRADVLVTPSIDAGNILGKGVKYLGGSITAHVVVGARVPILIPSRVESAEDKLHSIALGVIISKAQEPRITNFDLRTTNG
jgi:phosphate butyryltransferase